MELIEKKEGESVDQSSFNNLITNKEAEERQARDLKAGLHPLKVSLSPPPPSPSLFLFDISAANRYVYIIIYILISQCKLCFELKIVE